MTRRKAVLAIFVLTVTVRAALLSRVPRADVVYQRPSADGQFHSWDEAINVGIAVAQKGEFADPFGRPTGATAHVPPAYPLITAGIFRLFGYGFASALVRDAVMIVGFGLLYASLPAAGSALGLGWIPGAISGFIAAAFPIFRSCEVFRSRDESLAALILCWLTVLFFRMCSGNASRMRDAAVFGAGWGILLLIQPATLLVLLAFGLIWMVRMGMGARSARQALTAAAIVVLLLAPWTVRNYRQFGKWFFMRDNAGLELRVSFGPRAEPTLTGNLESGWYQAVHPTLSDTALAEVRRLGEIGFNREMQSEALAWMASHPARVAQLIATRFALFWTDWPRTPITFVERSVLSILAWTGLAMTWRSGLRLQTIVLGAVLASYPVTYYLDQYSPRYVIAICFALFIPAGYAIERVFCARRTAATVAAE